MEKTKKLLTIATCLIAAPSLVCFLMTILGLFSQEGGINTNVLSWAILVCNILFVIAFCIDVYLFITSNIPFSLILIPILLLIASFCAYSCLNLIGAHPLFWLLAICAITLAMINMFIHANKLY